MRSYPVQTHSDDIPRETGSKTLIIRLPLALSDSKVGHGISREGSTESVATDYGFAECSLQFSLRIPLQNLRFPTQINGILLCARCAIAS